MNENAAEDRQLIARVLRGERRAMAQLYDRVSPAMRQTVGRLLGYADADFDDAMQTALIELMRSLPAFRGQGSLEAFASVVTARVVYHTIRTRKVERSRAAGVDVDEVSAPAHEDVEKATFARSVLRRIKGHLDAIDPVKAWTYLLHDVCGYRLEEIATITGASVSAAQSRLVRGRSELEKRIATDEALASELERPVR